MSYDRITFAGSLRSRSNIGLIGARVELVDPKTEEIADFSFSNEDGQYRIAFNLCDNLKLFERIANNRFDLRAVDANGIVLAHKRNRLCKPGEACQTDLIVPQTRLRDFKPFGQPIERLKGGLIDTQMVDMIDTAIYSIVPKGAPGHNRYLRAVRCQFPDPNIFDRLLDDSWGVLDGNRAAQQRFRATLDLIAERLPVSEHNNLLERGAELLRRAEVRQQPIEGNERQERFLMSIASPAAFRPNPDQPLRPHPCLAPLTRLIPAYAAALYISRTVSDSAYLLGALEHGLCNLGMMNQLLETAIDALSTDDVRGLQSMLDHFAAECGADDGPLPDFPEYYPTPNCPEPPLPPDPLPDPCDIERWDCVQELLRNLVGSRSFGDPYIIDSITPIDACPGDTVLISGSNFGSVPGIVCFPFGSTASAGSCVEADIWTDTEIHVTVPDSAGSGNNLYLNILEGTTIVCDRVIGISRRGEGVSTFLGGQALISSLKVDGQNNPACAEPNTTVSISWIASRGGTGTTVRVRVTDGATIYMDQSGLPTVGSIDFTTPVTNTERSLTVTATADNPCGNDTRTFNLLITVVPELTILGMEVTQGIQVFPLQNIVNANPGEAVAWTSLPTIAEKDTIVRVYVACDRQGFLNDQVQNVTGTLRVNGTTLVPINGITPTNPAGNPFVTALRKQNINRAQTNHTLNFRINDALSTGAKTLRATVVAPTICGIVPSATMVTGWTWKEENALRVRFVRIRDNRPAPNGTNTRPTAAQARFTIQRAFDLLPSPATDIGPASQELWTTARAFNNLNGLQNLLEDLDDEHNCSFWEWLSPFADCPDDDHANWVGLTIPFNRGIGYRPGNTCISAIYPVANGQGNMLRIKTAHELGHNLSFMHVNRSCGGAAVGGGFYNHPNNGNLQEVPFDPFWNQAITGSIQDFMSYGCSRWVSADSWTRLQSVI